MLRAPPLPSLSPLSDCDDLENLFITTQERSSPLGAFVGTLTLPPVLDPVLHDVFARWIEFDPLVARLTENAMRLDGTRVRIVLEELTPLRLRLARRVASLLFPYCRFAVLCVRTSIR